VPSNLSLIISRLALLILLLGVTPTLFAATYYVGNITAGVDTTNCTSSGNSDCTLLGALSLATTDGDFVRVEQAGTYTDPIVIVDKKLTLMTDVGVIAILVGDGTDTPVIDISGSASTAALIIDGFTINNAKDDGAAARGISITSSAAPTLKNLILKGNQITGDGGGIYVSLATMDLQTSTIGDSGDKNMAADGGGVYAKGITATLNISDSTFTSNDSVNGGAIYIYQSDQTTIIINTNFTDNTATNDGGAIHGYWGSPVDITRGTWSGNVATNDGGAIHLDSGSDGPGTSLTITNGTYTDNIATNGSGGAIYTNKLDDLDISNAIIDSNDAGGWAGGLHLGNPLSGATVTISSSSIDSNTSASGGSGINIAAGTAAFDMDIGYGTTIDSNVINDAASWATNHGAGIRLTGTNAVDFTMFGGSISSNIDQAGSGAGGALYTTGPSSVALDGVTMNSNTVEGYGGAISLSNTGTTTISKSYIQGNSSLRDGGGIRINNGTTATITNTIISGNRLHGGSGTGGGIKVELSATLNLYNSTVAGNRSDFSGGGIYSSGSVTIRNSIIYGNDGSSSVDFSGTVDEETTSIIGTGDPDPLFVDTQLATAGAATTAGDYRLCYTTNLPVAGCGATISPGIFTGGHLNAPSTDIVDQSRPQGNGYDMGAYEYAAGAPTYAISGTVYTDEGATTIADGATVRLIVNGVSQGTDTTTSGAYSISYTTSANDAIIVYIDGHTSDGSTVTISPGGFVTEFDIYADHLITRHDNGGSLTNANMTTALGAYSDAEILYTTDGSDNLTVTTGKELLIWAGSTFTPGAIVNAHDVDIDGIFTASTFAINVDGNWDATGGTFISSGTVTFDGAADQTLTTNAQPFGVLTLNNSGTNGTNDNLIVSGTLDVNGLLTITDGDLDISSTNNPAVNTAGDVTIDPNGSIDVTGRTANWTFDGTSILDDNSSTGPQDFEDVVVNGTSLTLSGDVKVQTMTVSVGTLYAANADVLEIDGSGTPFQVTDTFTAAGTSLIKYSGTTATNIATTGYKKLQLSGATTYSLTGHLKNGIFFSALTIDSGATLDATVSNFDIMAGSIINNGTYLAQGSTIFAMGGWTNTGTFTAGTSEVQFVSNLTHSVTGSTTFNDFTVVETVVNGLSVVMTFDNTATQTVTGVLTLDGTVITDHVKLVSDLPGTPWSINLEGSKGTLDFVDVTDSDASGSTVTKPIAPTNSIDSGNNIDWFSGGITLSGIVYDGEASSPITTPAKTVRLYVNGVQKSTDETDGTGRYSFSQLVNSGDTILVYLEGETEDGSTVTVSDGSSAINDLHIYRNRLIVRHDNGGSMTNTLLDVADSGTPQAEMLFSATGGPLVVTAATELFIPTGHTFVLDDSVTTTGVDNNGTFTAGANAIEVSTSWDNDAAAIFTSTGTTTFTSIDAGETITSNGDAFGAVVFDSDDATGEWTLQDDLTATAVTVTDGELIDNAQTVTVNGSISIASTAGILTSTGRWVHGVSSNIVNGNYTYNFFNELQIAAGITSTRTGSVSTHKVIIDAGATLSGAGNVMMVATPHNDFIDLGAGASLDKAMVVPAAASSLTQKAITADIDLSLGYQDFVTVQMTGDWSLKSLEIFGDSLGVNETAALTLDTNGYNLTTTADLTLGLSVGPNSHRGKILFDSGTHSIGGNISVAQGTETTHGYFDLGSADISVGSDIDFSDATVIPGTSTVTLNGSVADQTITSVSQSFNHLEINNSNATATDDDIVLADALDVNGDLTITDGELEAGAFGISVAGNWIGNAGFTSTGTVTFDADTDHAISGSTTFNNLSLANSTSNATDVTLTFPAGLTQTINGTVTLNGLDANNRINLVSSTEGTQWKLNLGAGAVKAIDYVDVTDSDASGSNVAQKPIDNGISNNVDGGNNTDWFSGGITLSGIVYDGEAASPITTPAKTVRLYVNGVQKNTAETDGTGRYTFSQSVNSGDTVLVYLEGEMEDGSTVTVSDGSSAINDLHIYRNRLIVRHDNSGSMTNTLLDVADSGAPQAEMLFSATGGPLTVTAATELFIPAGHTFALDDSVTTIGFDNNGTFTAGANAINVSANWDVDAAGVFTSTGTVTFDATGGSNTITPGGTDTDHDFQNIIFNDAAGTATFQLAGAIDVDGNFTVTDGIVDTTGANYAITVGGNFAQAAAAQVEANASSITVASNFSADGTTDSSDFNNASLTLTGASGLTFTNLSLYWVNGFNNLTAAQGGNTTTLNNNVGVLNQLTLGSGALTGVADIVLAGAGDVLSFDPNSTLSISALTLYGTQNLPTLNNGYDCNISLLKDNITITQTGNISITGSHNLNVFWTGQPARTMTYDTAGFDLNVSGSLTVGAGSDTATKTLDITNSAVSVGGAFLVRDGTNVITETDSTLTLNGGGAQTVTTDGEQLHNLVVTNASDIVTFTDAFTMNDFSAVTPSTSLKFKGLATYTINGTLDINGQATGTKVVMNSTDTNAYVLDVTNGEQAVFYVDVSYSDALSNDIIAYNSTDTIGNDTLALTPHWVFAGGLTVSKTADTDDGVCDADCSLREAMTLAVSNDLILFDVAVFDPASPATISPTSALPAMNAGGVTIDASNAGVIIDGSGAGVDIIGIQIGSANNTVKGLTIQNFTKDGIRVWSAGGNTIGGDNTTGAGPTGEGNRITGNGDDGLDISTDNNFIYGNLIGTDGTNDLGNAAAGIRISGNGNRVGNATAATRNISSGNDGNGLYLAGDNNIVQGNYLGTNSAGTALISNGSTQNVYLNDTTGNTLGGLVVGARNIIAGTSTYNIYSSGVGTNAVQGNYIGVDVNGAATFTNGTYALRATSGATVDLGHASEVSPNVIDGHGFGLFIDGASNTINLAGTIDVNNQIVVHTGGGTLNMNAATLRVGSHLSFSSAGILNAGTSMLIIDGDVMQVITSKSKNYNDIQVTNNSSTVIFDDGLTVNNFTAETADSFIKFKGLATYTINGSLSLNGQATGTEMVMTSTDTNAYVLDVTNGDQSVSYVDVSYSDAASNDIIAYYSADTIGNDTLAATPHWVFANDLVVSKTADTNDGVCDADCSLREAMTLASPDDIISFDVAVFDPAAPATISPTSALPTMNAGSVTIDASNAGVIIDGSGAGVTTIGIQISSANNTIKGLTIQGFTDDGIKVLSGNGNTIGGDRTNGSGPTGEGNKVISNGVDGVDVASDNNSVFGNYLGSDGTNDLGNALDGLKVTGDNNTIGNATPETRNIISGNDGSGIHVSGADNTIQGNYVGLNSAATSIITNGNTNIYFNNAAGTIFGGLTVGARNILANSGSYNIYAAGSSSVSTLQGNYIGVDVNGDETLVGAGDGIYAVGGATVNIGHASEAASNIIGGHTAYAINIEDASTTINLAGVVQLKDPIRLISSATLNMNSATLNISSDLQLYSSATLNAGTSTVVLDGSSTQSIRSESHTYNNVEVTNATALVSFIDAFTANDFTVVTPDSSLVFKGSATYIINGTLDINGQATGTEISLNSTDTNPFTLDVIAAGQNVSYVDVQYAAASSNDITASNSINSGNNDDGDATPHWVFDWDISGTVYTDEGTTNMGVGKTVRLLINGVDSGTAETNSAGQFGFLETIVATDTVLVYIEGETEDGAAVSVAGGATLNGLDIYQDRLIVRHDNSGSMTNTLLDTADGATPQPEMLYSATGGPLVVTATTELFIPATHTFALDNTVDTTGLDIIGTLIDGANAINVSGEWDATGGVFTSTGTVTFDAISGTNLLTPGGTDVDHDFYNIIFNDAAGSATWELQGALDVDNNLTITDGIVDTNSASSYTITIANDLLLGGGNLTANGSTISIAGSLDIANIDNLFTKGTSIVDLTGSGNVINPNYYNRFHHLKTAAAGETTTKTGGIRTRILEFNTGTFHNAVTDNIYVGKNASAEKIIINEGVTFTGDTSIVFDSQGTTFDGGDYSTAQVVFVNGTSSLTLVRRDLLVKRITQLDNSTFDLNGFNLTVTNELHIGNGSVAHTPTLNAGSGTITTNGVYLDSFSGNPTLNMESATINNLGDWTVEPDSTVNPGTSTLSMKGTIDQTITSQGHSFNNLIINNIAAANVTLADALDVNGDLTLTEGDFTIANFNITTAANVTLTGGSIDDTSRTNGTWTFDGTSMLNDGIGEDLNKVVVDGTSLTLAGDALVESMTVTNGTLDLGSSGYVLEIDGSGNPLINNDTFTASTSTVRYSGTAATDITTLTYSGLQFSPGSATTYSLTGNLSGSDALTGNLTIDSNATLDATGSNYDLTAVNITNNGTYTPQGSTITLSGNWSNTGTFTPATSSIVFTDADHLINGSTTFNDFSVTSSSDDSTDATLTFDNTAIQTVNGTFILDGLDADDRINLVSDTPGSQWSLNLQGTKGVLDFVEVTDSDASASIGSLKLIDPTSSINSGNNVDWFSAITLSGIVYDGEEVSPITSPAKTVRLYAGGVQQGTAETDGTGRYTFSQVVNTDETILLYIEGESEDGAMVTVSGGGTDLTDLHIYRDRLIVRHDNGGSMTNTLLDVADSGTPQAEMLFSATGGPLLVTATTELYIPTGHTLVLDNTLDTTGMDINGILTGGANAINVEGDWDATSGIFASTGTVTFDATSGSKLITPGGTDADHDFQNIIFNDAAGTATWELQGALDVDNDLTITDGIVDSNSASSYTISIANDLLLGGGNLTANGSTISIAGDLEIPNIANLFTKGTSIIELTGSGNISNANYFNRFHHLKVAVATQISTKTADIRTRILEFGTGTFNNVGVDNLIFGEDANSEKILINPDPGVTFTGGFFEMHPSGTDVTFDGGDYSIAQMTFSGGNTTKTLVTRDLSVSRLALMDSSTVNLNGLNLDITVDDLHIGNGSILANPIFNAGSGTITTQGIYIEHFTGVSTFNMNSATINNAEYWTVEMGDIVNSGTSTVFMNGTIDQTVTSSGQAFNNLVLNNAGTSGSDDIILADALDIKGDLTFTDGDLTVANIDITTAANVTLTGGSIDDTGRTTGTWIFDGTSILNDGVGEDFNRVIVNGTSLTLASNAKVETMTVTTGTLDLGSSSYVLEIDGSGTPLINSDTFTAGTSTVRYTGTAATDITTLIYSGLQFSPGSATTYSLTGNLSGVNALTGNLTIDSSATLDATGSNYDLTAVNITNSGTYTPQGSTITLGGNWSNTGTFTSATSSMVFTDADHAITGSTTFNNFLVTNSSDDSSDATLTFDNTAIQTVNGTFTLDGLDADDRINLVSDSPGSQWSLNLQGTKGTLDFVEVTDSDASTSIAGVKSIAPANSLDGGNTIDWFPYITLSGIVYDGEAVSPFTATAKTVRLYVDGVQQGTALTDGTGRYTFSQVVNPDETLLVYIEGESEDGSTVTVSDGVTDLTDLHIYRDRLIVRHDNGGSMSNTLLDVADSGTPQSEMLFSATGGPLLVTATTELYIPAGHTFVLGNTIDTTGIDINGTLTSGAYAINVKGAWDATGGIFTTTGTVTFDVTSGTHLLTPGGTDANHDFQNIIFDDAAGSATWSQQGALDVNGDFTLSSGTLNSNGNTIILAGNWSRAAASTYTSGSNTVLLDGTNQMISGSTTFNNLSKISDANTLTFESSSTQTINGLASFSGVGLGSELTLRATTPGLAANIAFNGTTAFDRLDIADSDAATSTVAKPLLPANSIDSGNNLAWFTWSFVTIDGHVYASDRVTPLVGVQVRMIVNGVDGNLTATTDGSGAYTIPPSVINSGDALLLYLDTNGGDQGATVTIGSSLDQSNIDIYADHITTRQDNAGVLSNLNMSSAWFSDSDVDYSVTSGNLTVTAPTLLLPVGHSYTPAGDISAQDFYCAGIFEGAANTLDINGDFTAVGSCSFTSSSGLLSLAGDLDLQSGSTFIHNSGVVILDGSAAQNINSSNQIFNTLNVENSSAIVTFDSGFTTANFSAIEANSSLRFTAAADYTVTNDLTLDGQSTGNEVVLASTLPGTQWNLNFSGATQGVDYTDIQDANASSGSTIVTSNTIDSGNNSNFNFGYAVSTVVAEISPTSVSVNQAVSPFTFDLLPTINPVLESGFDNVAITAPAGYSALAVSTVAIGGSSQTVAPSCPAVAAGEYCATVVGQVMTVTLGSPVVSSTDVQLTFDAVTPSLAGSGTFSFTVDDSTTSYVAQSGIAGDADGDAGDANTLDVLVLLGTDPAGSTFTASPLIVVADGTSQSIMTVTLLDANQAPVSTKRVAFSSDRGVLDTIIQPTLPTAADGIAQASISSLSVGKAVISAVDTTDGIPLLTQATLYFTQGDVLQLDKIANKDEVVIGDVVSYSVDVKNSVNRDVVQVALLDKIPPNFKYVKGSALLDGVSMSDPTGNRTLTFNLGTVAALDDANGNGEADRGEAGFHNLRYQLIVGSGATPGDYSNAITGNDGCALCVISNTATAEVEVVLDPLFDLGTIIGKVFHDKDGDGHQSEGEKGVAGAMVVLEEGTYVLTDSYGRYHFPAVQPGQRLLKINRSTLPSGTGLTTSEARVLSVTPGLLVKANFGVSIDLIEMDVGRKGERAINIDVSESMGSVDLMGNANIGVLVINGSLANLPTAEVQLHVNGLAVEKLDLSDGKLANPGQFHTKVTAAEKVKDWSLTIMTPKGVVVRQFSEEGVPPAVVLWDGLDETGEPVAGSVLYDYQLKVNYLEGASTRSARRLIGIDNHKVINLRLEGGAFASGAASLSDEAKLALHSAAKLLRTYPDERILIEGYADSLGSEALNLKLSKQRANAVFSYMIEALAIAPNRFKVVAYGEENPIADNGTEAGRAANRRVELKAAINEVKRAKRLSRFHEKAKVILNGKPLELRQRGRFTAHLKSVDAAQIAFEMSDKNGRSVKMTITAPPLEILQPQQNMRIPSQGEGEDYRITRAASSDEIGLYRMVAKVPANSRVQIDGQDVAVSENGLFEHMLKLRAGLRSYDMAVTDPDGYTQITAIKVVTEEFESSGRPLYLVEPIPRLTVNLPPEDAKLNAESFAVSGTTNPDNQLFINGEAVEVGLEGRFVQQVPLEQGANAVTIKAVDAEGFESAIESTIQADDSELFFMAFVDGKFSQLTTKGYVEGSGNKEGSTFYSEGRLAYYLKGRVLGKYLITSAMDTGQSEIDKLFEDLDDDGSSALLKNLDPDTYYPVYGDNSTLVYDTQSQGKFYLAVDSDTIHAVIGNYPLNLTETELAAYQRTFYGAHFRYQSLSTTALGQANTHVELFAAQVRSAHAHDELRATGGSLYYLSQKEVIEGSAQVELVIKDKNTGLILQSIPQELNRDYTIKYLSGRLLFKRPLSSVTGDSGLINSEPLAGHHRYLHVDYEYEVGVFEKQASGGRVRQQIGEHLAIGVTHVNDELDVGVYELQGVDAELRFGRNSRLLAEVAESRGSDGSTSYSSDGGLSYSYHQTNPTETGQARKLAVEVDVGEWFDKPDYYRAGAYIKESDAGFNSNGNSDQSGTRKTGINTAIKVNEQNSVRARVDREERIDTPQTGEVSNSQMADIQWQYQEEAWKVTSELQAKNSEDSSGATLTEDSAVATRVDYQATKDLALNVAHQQTLSGVDNNQSRVGADYQLTESWSMQGQTSHGTTGDAVEAGIGYSKDQQRLYLTERMVDDQAGRQTATVVGGESKIGRDSRIYTEYMWQQTPGGAKNLSLVGAERRWDLGSGWRFSLSGERADIVADDSLTRRSSIHALLGYNNGKGFSARSSNEVRWEQGSEEREQVLTSNHFELKMNPDYTLLGKLRYSKTENVALKSIEAKLEEYSLGVAYRPVASDRFNALGRITRLTEQRPITLADSDLTTTSMDVLSLEWSFDLTKKIEWVNKLAGRVKEEVVGNHPETLSHSYLALYRLNYALTQKFGVGVEYRTFDQVEANDQRQGWLGELTWRAHKHIRLGVGYNFTTFSDNEFSNNDYSVEGAFLRLQGIY
jgi:CSLREA domain-containing protein